MSNLNAEQFGKHEAQHVADTGQSKLSPEAWPTDCPACQLAKGRIDKRTVLPQRRYQGAHA